MDVDTVIEQVMEAVSREADNSHRWSQEESIDIYEGVASQCRAAAQAIREDMQ